MKKLLPFLLITAVSPVLSVGANEGLRLAPDWALLPGDRDYLTTGNTERGMAHNPATDHIYVVSRADGIQIAIVDAQTGDHVGFLDAGGIEGAGGTFDLNMIGVADDGAIYAGNLTTDAASDAFRLWRWEDEDSWPTEVYAGDPGFEPGARWGDNLAVRGAAESTQVLILSHGSASNPSDATILQPVAGWLDSFEARWLDQNIDAMGLGSAFGAGDMYWATRPAKPVFEVEFDAVLGTGTLHRSFGTDEEGNVVDAALMDISPITVDPEAGLFAGVREATAEVYLYDLETMEEGVENSPLSARQLPTSNSSPGSGSGALAFDGDRLYVMHANNGLLAFDLTETTDLERWRMEHFGTIENEGDAANEANPAGDGLPNLMKFALGLDPHAPSREMSPIGGIEGFATPLWTIAADERDYLPSSGNSERGMDYNPITGNVYVVSRADDLDVAVVDGQTGEHVGFLNVSGIEGGTYDLNTIGVAADGAIYAGNLTTDAGSSPYRLYRWADENAAPVEIYSGQPGAEAGGRWGDNIAVRGEGASTQVLVLSHAGGSDSQHSILHPSNGAMDSFEAAALTPEIASMGIGTDFAGDDRFWATRRGIPLHEVSFDASSGDADLLREFGTFEGETVDATLVDMSLIAIHPGAPLLAGFSFSAGSLYLYNTDEMIEGEENTPLDSFSMEPLNASAASGLGGVAFADDRVFAMPANNGMVAFDLSVDDEGEWGFETDGFNTLTFTRPSPAPSGVSYIVEASGNLREWDSDAVELVSETPVDDGERSMLTYRDTTPAEEDARRFIRLRVVEEL